MRIQSPDETWTCTISGRLSGRWWTSGAPSTWGARPWALGLTSGLLRPHPLLRLLRGEERKLLTGCGWTGTGWKGLKGDPHLPGPAQRCACICGSFCLHVSLVPRAWVTENTQPGRAVPAPSSEDQGKRRHPGTRRGSRGWPRGSGSTLSSPPQAEGPCLRDPQLLWALDPQDRPGGTGPGPKGWTQGPWDFPPCGTACSLGGHPLVPTDADLQPFPAAVSVNKPHSAAELFINEHTLHLRPEESRAQRMQAA